MQGTRSPLRVAVFGFYGGGNLGDALVAGVLIDNIRKRHPEASLLQICQNPAEMEKRFGIPAFDVRPRVEFSTSPVLDAWSRFAGRSRILRIVNRVAVTFPRHVLFFLRSFKVLHGVDVMAVAGSGILLDNEQGGPWNHPFVIFAWSTIARLSGARLAFMSMGAGPIDTRMGRWFLARSLSMAEYCSLRDEHSLGVVQKLGIGGINRVCPDQGFAAATGSRHSQDGAAGTIGVAPFAYCDPRFWPQKDAAVYAAYVGKLVDLSGRLLQKGYRLRFLQTRVGADDKTVDDVIRGLERNGFRDRIEVPVVSWYPEVFSAIDGCEAIIASRFHAVVSAYLMRVPAVALSYDRKTDDLLEAFGQEQVALRVETFTVDDVLKCLEVALARKKELLSLIETILPGYQKRLNDQFDAVLLKESVK